MLNVFVITIQLILTAATATYTGRSEGQNIPVKTLVNTKSTDFVSEAHHIERSLPAGYVKDGSVDYTDFIQTAINQFDNVIFPGFPLLINDKGLKIGSNKHLRFMKGSELRMVPSTKTHYAVLDIKGVSNVTIHNPVIKGDRYRHLGTSGEWGMGIRINGSSNINVFGADISECWGDGIYIGQNKRLNSKNIVIKDARLRKNRRDGISIISVDGLVLENVYAAYQDGTKPMCGINFESNNFDCEIKNVKVINPRTEFNNGSGIQLGLSTMLGGGSKNIDVTILNHVDVGSQSFALKVACKSKPERNRGSVVGNIKIINPTWNGTIGDRPLAFITDQQNLKLTVLSPKVKNSKGSVLSSKQVKAILNKHSNGDLKVF
jgi:hypothetical protein